MKKRHYLVLMAIGIGALWLASAGGGLFGSAPVATDDKNPAAPPGLGRPFVGSWYCLLYVGDSTIGVPSLGTLNADGTLLFSGAPVPGAVVSTGHGCWNAVAPHMMVGTSMSIGTDSDGNPLFFEKGPLRLTLSQDGNRCEGSIAIGVYSADQDPLEDDPLTVLPCTLIGRRITVE